MLSFGQCTKKTNNITFFMLQQLPLLHICEKRKNVLGVAHAFWTLAHRFPVRVTG